MKRNSRANTILDYDDLLFLHLLNKKEKNKFVHLHYDAVREKLNMSYSSFLNHLKRLNNYRFLEIITPEDKTIRFKGKKINYVGLSEEGFYFLDAMTKTPYISKNFEAYKLIVA